MIERLPGAAPQDFIWGGGIEDTFVPQTRPNHRALDEYDLMGHYTHWREDIDLARDLGLTALRWGIPWYRVEQAPGEYDWTWTDRVIRYMVEEVGITPIIDLMHYGCPFWLRSEFANPEYPAAVARYAGAVARRYGHLVKWYTPLNEPIVNALMCGRRGLWPPYLRGHTGYVRIMLQLARGIVASVNELKGVQPEAIMVHVEAAGITRASRPDLDPLAAEDQLSRFLCYDLITGRVTYNHPFYVWLVRNGAQPDLLSELAAAPIDIDVLGLNFYPEWSTRQLYIDRTGRAAYRVIERAGEGFSDMVEEYQARYSAPVIVTETSAFGSNKARSQWLTAALTSIRELRSKGIPVLGYTWFPLFTMIDWRYRNGRADADKYRKELGLYKLGGVGQPRWIPTPLVSQFKSSVANPEASVGLLAARPLENSA